jgi:hypothetical protein
MVEPKLIFMPSPQERERSFFSALTKCRVFRLVSGLRVEICFSMSLVIRMTGGIDAEIPGVAR